MKLLYLALVSSFFVLLACSKSQEVSNIDGTIFRLSECGALVIQTSTGETFLPKNIGSFSRNVNIEDGQQVVFSYTDKQSSPANTCVRTMYPVTITTIRNQ